MGKATNIIGQKFERLTVIEKLDEKESNGSYLWLCRCDCGSLRKATYTQLNKKRIRSCGCIRKEQGVQIGQRFGRLVVEEETDDRKHGGVVWKCKCDCGEYTYVITRALNAGDAKSCGCLRVDNRKQYIKKVQANSTDFTGQKFGRLTVIEPLVKDRKGWNNKWVCRCDCGSIVSVKGADLANGHTRSCDCLMRESSSIIGKKAIEIATKNLNRIDGTVVESLNAKLSSRNKTGVKGVCVINGRYVAQIGFKNKKYHLGRYNNLEDAAKVRKEAEDRLHGEFLEWFYETFPEKKKPQDMK